MSRCVVFLNIDSVIQQAAEHVERYQTNGMLPHSAPVIYKSIGMWVRVHGVAVSVHGFGGWLTISMVVGRFQVFAWFVRAFSSIVSCKLVSSLSNRAILSL